PEASVIGFARNLGICCFPAGFVPVHRTARIQHEEGRGPRSATEAERTRSARSANDFLRGPWWFSETSVRKLAFPAAGKMQPHWHPQGPARLLACQIRLP